jgi:hypothetical protein
VGEPSTFPGSNQLSYSLRKSCPTINRYMEDQDGAAAASGGALNFPGPNQLPSNQRKSWPTSNRYMEDQDGAAGGALNFPWL